MTLSRQRKPVSIILLLVIYTTAFLIHDLAHSPLLTGAALLADHGSRLSSRGGDGAPGDGDRIHPAQDRHHCPFCSGFTGSVTVAPLPPPSESNGKLPLPPTASHLDDTRFFSIARAPPAA